MGYGIGRILKSKDMECRSSCFYSITGVSFEDALFFGFDLSWLEYSWIASALKDPSVLMTLPKIMPNVLSIETIPGSICQLRLLTNQAHELPSGIPVGASRERDLEMALSRFIALANQTKGLVDNSQIYSDKQQSLFLSRNEEGFSQPKPKRKRGRPKI